MLQVENLHAIIKDGKKTVLKGISFQAKKGDLQVILGPNGSGKSTFGKVLLGHEAYHITQGSIIFEGEDITNLPTDRRAQKGLFLSFQAPPEIEGVRVKDFLIAAKKQLSPKETSSFRLQKRLKAIFQQLRLPEDFLDRELHRGFSGGERKKLELATLLFLEFPYAFLDEIDSGVDIDTLQAIGETLKKYHQEGNTIILVTHTEKLLRYLEPTKVHIFCQGKIIKSGGKEIIDKVHEKGFDAFLPEKENLLTVLE